MPISKAKTAIQGFERIKIPKDGRIEGLVTLYYWPSGKYLPGVEILIRGDGRVYRAVTDKKGWFHLLVPPGAYSARAKSTRAHPIIPYGLSYANPMQFHVKPGRCAGLQLIANSLYSY